MTPDTPEPEPSPSPHAPGDAELLAAFLAGRDERCPTCDYSVRDLRSGVCPECGKRLALRLVPADARLAPFVTGIVGLSLAFWILGLGAFLSAMFMEAPWTAVPTFVGAAVQLVVLRAWVVGRRRLSRAPLRVHWPLAILCFVESAALACIYIWVFVVVAG
jgi:hypothetical protein